MTGNRSPTCTVAGMPSMACTSVRTSVREFDLVMFASSVASVIPMPNLVCPPPNVSSLLMVVGIASGLFQNVPI